MKQVFEYIEYKEYLKAYIKEASKVHRGAQSRLAEAIQCRPGYLSQVLGGDADFSLDQAGLASLYLGHSKDENRYFLNLVTFARAATSELKKQILRQLEEQRESFLNLKNRFQVQSSLTQENEARFYSSWHYLAILTLLSIPNFNAKDVIASRLSLKPDRVAQILAELLEMGVIVSENGNYRPGTLRTHLGKDSPLIRQHHGNWRLQALHSIERQNEADLHYSSVISLSARDLETVKLCLIRSLEEIAKVVAPSPEEKICSLCLDLFEI